MEDWADVSEVEHTADLALRVRGSDLGSLLSHAAVGLAGLMVNCLSSVPLTEERSVTVEAPDVESLLVAWLEELLFWAEREMLVCVRVQMLHATPSHLIATVTGGRVDHLDRHVKAVTYHNLHVSETKTGLEATVVFDI